MKIGIPFRSQTFVNGYNFSNPVGKLKKDHLPDGTSVTTIFLGADTGGDPYGRPILWGTMILGGPHDKHEVRYASPKTRLPAAK